MEADGQESSENLSDENDQAEEVNEDFGTKRSYQCTFCRRGFTNAQALGGHMNIHRKDRAKAKHISVNSAIANKTYEDQFSTRYMAEHTKYYPVFEAQRNYHHTYYQPSPSNPRYPPVSYSFEHNNLLAASRAHAQPLSQEMFGANLSLGMGHHHADENQMRVGVKSVDGEVDLELRLGYHRY